MRKCRVASMIIAVAGLFCAPGFALAQTATGAPPHAPLQKTIGGVSKPEVVPSLIVFNSRGVSLQGNKLVLTGISRNSIVFADRPVRAAGHDLTSNIIDDWATGSDNFAKDPPNATVSAFSKEGATIRDAVVVLKTPKLEGDRLTFDVDVLEGNLTGADGPASVFIDIIGRPLTPFSYGASPGAPLIAAPITLEQPPLVPLQPTVRRLPTAPTLAPCAVTTLIRLATDVGGIARPIPI